MAPRRPGGSSRSRARGTAPAGRALLVVLFLLAAVVAVRLAEVGPVPPPPPVLAPEDVAEQVGPAEEATGRHRLRSVSTAPSRPRLAQGEPGEDAEVEVRRAVFTLEGADGATLGAVRSDPDVAHAAALAIGEVALADGLPLTVGAVDPAAFRPLAPAVTARAAGVWSVLDGGGLLLSPEQAARLGVRPGEALRLASGRSMPVAGAASNGAPPLVHALSARLPEDAKPVRDLVLVALHPDRHVPTVAERLAAATGTTAAPLPAGEPAVASLVGSDPATVAAFEPFSYTEADGGRIAVDPAWEEAHIVRADVPVLGEVRCHRLLLAPLRAALQQVVDDGLAEHLDPADYGGCYLPRHIDWNPAAGLSMHAWGLAIDVNVSTNGLGAPPQLHPGIVEAFEARGFGWGGRWGRPDGMHLELRQLTAS